MEGNLLSNPTEKAWKDPRSVIPEGIRNPNRSSTAYFHNFSRHVIVILIQGRGSERLLLFLSHLENLLRELIWKVESPKHLLHDILKTQGKLSQ